jgi:hypothetical protein
LLKLAMEALEEMEVIVDGRVGKKSNSVHIS